MSEPIRKVTLMISDIKADTEQNLVPEKVDALKDSIRKNGLIHPIAVTEDHVLVSGHHRFQAVLDLAKEDPEAYQEVPARIVSNELSQLHIETTEKLFRPDLSILEKAESFQQYFEHLKYGEDKHKTVTIFKTLDISRRTFFNFRAIVECLSEDSKQKVRDLSHTGLSNSMAQLLALSEYTHKMQAQILEIMERESYQTVFEAIKSVDFSEVEQLKTKKRKFLKSPSLKLSKELRAELLHLSKKTGKGQNELFNEIFEAGLEIAQAKYE